jgi:hypothetical protein
VAALIKQALGLDADLEAGSRGEFSVWVDDRKVAEKSSRGFPSEPDVVRAVTDAAGAKP